MNISDYWPLLEALKEGKTVQYRSDGRWIDETTLGLLHHMCAGHEAPFFRVKPPEPKVIWVNEYADTSGWAYSSEDSAKCSPACKNAIRIAVRYVEQPEAH